MRIKFYAVCLVILCLFSLKTYSQTGNGTYGNSILTERPNTPIDSLINGFIEIVPQEYASNPTKNYPLIIFFEGINQLGNGGTELSALYGSNNVNQLPDIVTQLKLPGDVTGQNSFTVGPTTFHFIILIPQVRQQIRSTTKDYVATPGEVNDVVNYALQNYRVDVNRIYLGGLSLGGGAAVNYVGDSVAYGQRIAAVMSFSAATAVSDNHARVTNIATAQVPIWFFEVTGDKPYDSLGQDYIDSLDFHKPAYTAEDLITHYASGGHNSWEYALEAPVNSGNATYPNVYYWLLQKTRSIASQPVFPTISAGSDQTLNLPNGSMVVTSTGVSFTGATVTLSGTAPAGYSYQWVKVDGNGGTIADPSSLNTTVTDLMPGSYTYQLRVTDAQGLTTVSSVKVTVVAPPENKYARIEAEQYSAITGAQIDKSFWDQGPSYGLGYLSPGNGATYNLSTLGLSAGTYSLFIRYSSPYGNPGVQITVDGTTTYSTNLTSYSYFPNPMTWHTSNNVDIVLGTNSNIQIQSLADQWNFDYFELAQIASGTLPIKFVYFNSQCNGSSVNLQWKTAQEQNTKEFSIQRSTDGSSWTEIGKIAAAGQSGQERNYAFVDKTAFPNSMYRIVETDATGQQIISSIVRSSCSSPGNEITLYPNPSAGNSALSINLSQATSITMQVLDVKGAMMMERQIQLPQGSTTIPVNLTSYPNGVYTIALRMNGETRTLKMIKK